MSKFIWMTPANLVAPAIGGLTMLAIAASLTSCSPTLPACDASNAQDLLKTAILSRAQTPGSPPVTVTSLTNIQTSSHTPTNAVCTAHGVLSDGRALDFTYTLALSGSTVNLEITAAAGTGTPAATAAPAAAEGADAPAAGNEAADSAAAPAEGGNDAAPAEGAPPAEGETAK